ncbi:MAG: ATP-binding protein [Methylomonas sp.]|jgi:PAS domain S-box-containing protein|uniref:two-component system sensor histidine kinase NtrB n=1 Tax=Methylomonas sp. TaxID=418 RepID=UPI0025FC1715|nr:ATP-binding protein [Methylomonas sp.]MCK9607087.1 ATP-binding protein [Methylomonas sp.]
MKKSKIPPDELRNRAEQCLAQQPIPGQCHEDASCKLMHELDAYTLELEMQNEELKSAQAENQVALQRYTELYDFAPVGYLTLENTGRVVEINLAGAALLGANRGDIIDRSIVSYLTDRLAFKKYLQQAFLSKDNVIAELGVKRTNGGIIDIHLESRISLDEEGLPAVIHTIMTDISRRKSLERQLQQQRSEMDELIKQQVAIQTAAAIAHDLNQPLAAISAFGEVALRSLNKDDVSAQALERALVGLVEQAQRAGLCLHELLRFLQRGELVIEPINLNGLIEDVITIVRHDKFSCFQPELILQPNLPPVLANSLQVKKVLLNLLYNSLDAIREAGLETTKISIKVYTHAELNMAQVTIQDRGAGLDDEAIKRVFEPFFTTKRNGSGLGLAISRSLIEANGGQLWMDENVETGAIFHFTLPFALLAE